MSGDPFRIFKDNPSKHNTLKLLWPELYEALAPDAVPAADRVVFCSIGDCARFEKNALRHRAVARLQPDGPPACAEHLERYAARPGGWPLFPDRSDRQ